MQENIPAARIKNYQRLTKKDILELKNLGYREVSFWFRNKKP